MPLVTALQRQRQVNLCEFEASLVYRMSSMIANATQRNLSLKTNNNNKIKKQERAREIDSSPDKVLSNTHQMKTWTQEKSWEDGSKFNSISPT